MREIPLTQCQFAIVPDDWFEALNKYKWYAMWSPRPRTFYAVRNSRKDDGGDQRCIHMHRVILNASYGVDVDHKDGNGLHNVPPNIRLAPGTSNKRNRSPKRGTLSGLKGVYWCKNVNRWRAKIGFDGKEIHIG